jgi:hypothetical protein
MIGSKKIKLNDGAFVDILGLYPLLRRRCSKIFSNSITPLNPDFTLMFIYDTFPEGINYSRVFKNWETIKQEANRLKRENKMCYYRCIVDVKENLEYQIEAYQCEIIFYFLTRVEEFMQ